MEKTRELFNKYLKDLDIVSKSGFDKYGENWLKPDGNTMDRRSQVKSQASHSADAYMGITKDKDSGLHPDLHAAWRHMASYIRFKEGIKHPLDKE